MPSRSQLVSLFLLALGLSLAPTNWALAQERAGAEPSGRQLVLVLDASGSMWGQIDGEPKIRIARGVVKSLLANWNPTIDLGLTAYGHRREGDCDDIESLIAPGRSGAARSSAILTAIDELNPRGKSPLAAALEHAAQSISYRDRAATLLLVSDGRETCGADPCETAKQLARAGVDFTAHVVGFGVSDIDAEQLRCVAHATGGRFFGAADSGALLAALGSVVEEVGQAPASASPRVRSGASGQGKLSLRATLRDPTALLDAAVSWKIHRNAELVSEESAPSVLLALSDGEYRVDASYGDATVSELVAVRAGVTRTYTLDFEAGVLRVFGVMPPPGGAINDAIEWAIFERSPGEPAQERVAEGRSAGHAFVLPAGSYRVTGDYGKWSSEATIELSAGETVSIGLTMAR